MTFQQRDITVVAGVALLLVMTWSCGPANQPLQVQPRERPLPMGAVDTGPGSLEATRRALEGSWVVESFEVVDAGGARRPVKAAGQLRYDAFGGMSVRGVIEDKAIQGKVVIDYEGRIVIDTVKHEFYPADLVTDRPVDPDQVVAIAPEKVRRYELSGDSFVVTYLDAAANPTAVIRWRRSSAP